MNDAEPTAPAPALEYDQCIWGDLIHGTKDQIQALGIGVGVSFPGEIGATRRRLRATDPRGFMAEIERANGRDEDAFCVSIPLFKNLPPPWCPIAQPYCPGVTRREWIVFDRYSGTAEALAAAGLVDPAQLPGRPGMGKRHVTILPDGSAPRGRGTVNPANLLLPGVKEIQRIGADTFHVRVNVTIEEQQRRKERYDIAEREWKRQILLLPRPAPLSEARAAALARRSHLKLVWSAPGQIAANA